MTASVAPAGQARSMTDSMVELAILGILAERTEIYPSHLIGELRRRGPELPPAEVRPVLERLWQERRVARLWHRYMLPDRVEAVRSRWLAMIERQREKLEAADTSPDAYAQGRATLMAWDGWCVGDAPA